MFQGRQLTPITSTFLHCLLCQLPGVVGLLSFPFVVILPLVEVTPPLALCCSWINLSVSFGSDKGGRGSAKDIWS